MKERLLSLLQDEWKEKYGDDKEVRKLSNELSTYLYEHFDKEIADKLESLIFKESSIQEIQGFTHGFQCAVTLLMGGATV